MTEDDKLYDNTIYVLRTIGKLFYRVVIMIVIFSLYNHTFGDTTGLVVMAFMMSFAILFLTMSDISIDIETLESKHKKPHTEQYHTNKTIPTEREIILEERNKELALKLKVFEQ